MVWGPSIPGIMTSMGPMSAGSPETVITRRSPSLTGSRRPKRAGRLTAVRQGRLGGGTVYFTAPAGATR